MIVTKKFIPRRTILRGTGAALALPLLDAMVPALAAARNTAAKPVLRFGSVYAPCGMIMRDFWPATEGAAFEFTPILSPLEPLRNHLVILGGLGNKEANARDGEGTGDHARAGAAFLTSAHAKKTDGPDMRLGTSIDQIIAQKFAQDTQLPSLELTLSFKNMVGGCDIGFACPYNRTISWRTPTTPVPMENEPGVIFERLFGDVDSTDSKTRLARMQENRSILDSVGQEVASFAGRLGSGDRTKLTEYIEAIRDVERRIQKAEEQSDRELPLVERPTGGIPARFDDYAKLMFDLQLLALQTDLTRVFTFMLMHEGNDRPYPEIGVPDGHHPLTHNGTDAEALAKVTRINTFHTQIFAYFLEKLRSTPDGDGSLLDHSIMLYGSGISNGNTHSHDDLPIVLAGGGGGQIKGGRYIRYPYETPMANLHMTILDKLGVPVETFADSNGRLEGLSGV